MSLKGRRGGLGPSKEDKSRELERMQLYRDLEEMTRNPTPYSYGTADAVAEKKYDKLVVKVFAFGDADIFRRWQYLHSIVLNRPTSDKAAKLYNPSWK